jgi:hypothetical protein
MLHPLDPGSYFWTTRHLYESDYPYSTHLNE